MMRFSGTVAVALSAAAASSASAWPGWLPDVEALVVRRADSSSTSAASATSTGGSSPAKPSTTNLNTAGLSSTGGASKSGSSATGTASQPSGTHSGSSGHNSTNSGGNHTMFDPSDPAGSVVVTLPATTLGTQLYKIGDFVTWGWNYTNLQATPTAVDVMVSCAFASATYTLTTNMSADQTSYTWDTNAYQQTALAQPLLTQEYTLVIIDAESSVSATAEPGYLSPFTGYRFGLYAAQSYQNLSEFNCVTCSGASDAAGRGALTLALTMGAITLASFTWFVTGRFGL